MSATSDETDTSVIGRREMPGLATTRESIPNQKLLEMLPPASAHHAVPIPEKAPKTVTIEAGSNAPKATANGTDASTAGTTASTATTTTKVKKKKGHKHSASTQIPFIPAATDRGTVRNDAPPEDDDRIRLGICAMDKKSRSKPMAEILSRLDEEVFHVIFFGDDLIVNKPVEEWPFCHVLIAFYSKGYPLDKAMEYVELRKPFTLNDLHMQKLLMDRRRVYDLLQGSGIDVPRHVYLSRDDFVSTGTGDGNGNRDQEVVEHDDHIEVSRSLVSLRFWDTILLLSFLSSFS